ncbi:MAG TPA: SH3 domain-containing protein [Clostridiaceae bacterium]|nr:SH3 domain-containing protein [Clostridiaceae bacterium]
MAVIVFLFVIMFLGGAGYLIYYFLSMENQEVIPAFSEQNINLVIEGDVITEKHDPRIVEEEILIPFDTIKKYIDPYIYWDEKARKVTVTTKDRVIRMKTENLTAMVNNEPMELNIPVIEDGGVIYIPIEFLSDFYNIEVSYLRENNVIIIDFKNSVVQQAGLIDEKAVIRSGRSRRYPIVKKFDAGVVNDETLRVFEEYDEWYKVRASDGTIGYIEKRFVVIKRIFVNKLPEMESGNNAWKPEDGKINLVWEQVYSKRIDVSAISKMEGLDVVSPTWFQVENEHGKLINRADAKYVEWAHSNGYKVWALLANNFSDSAMTKKLLNSTDARENLIRELLAYAALYKLDGINIDFENVDKEDKDVLTQFVREAAPLLREQGLVVSIDINLHPCYDRKALAEAVDYVMIMAYDQHWKGGGKAGSVAQLVWVESIIKEFLKTIPRDKFILGIPLYTRLWTEEVNGEGGISLSSKALSMEDARKVVEENNAEVLWDEESGQFYAEFKDGKLTHKIWMEDVNSINLKSSLVHKYRLAGAASWSRNFAIPQVWEVFNRNLKLTMDYYEWKEQNSNIKYVYDNSNSIG